MVVTDLVKHAHPKSSFDWVMLFGLTVYPLMVIQYQIPLIQVLYDF